MNEERICIKCGSGAEPLLGGGFRCRECEFIMINQNFIEVVNESQ